MTGRSENTLLSPERNKKENHSVSLPAVSASVTTPSAPPAPDTQNAIEALEDLKHWGTPGPVGIQQLQDSVGSSPRVEETPRPAPRKLVSQRKMIPVPAPRKTFQPARKAPPLPPAKQRANANMDEKEVRLPLHC